jgi:asparagine synthase (glutamine-hydrolysing)
MCGLAGVLSPYDAPDVESVAAMTRRLVHRGPDAGAVVCRGPLALGHRRLAVIDPESRSDQPLTDETGRYCIALNGEVYNFRELRRELEAAGARFRTQGDSEVLLEAYKRWGTDCLQRVNGMFAFAIWDGIGERLVLARDRLGEKPLYYAVAPDRSLLFASELKALLEHPSVSRAIDPEALSRYLTLGYVPGTSCIVRGVEKLRPGHLLVATPGEPPRSSAYWDLAACFRDKARFRGVGEAAEALAELLDDSVRLRLVSDVPLGAFLSGGLDSAAVLAAMRRSSAGDATLAFSAGFREAGFDELPAAASTAASLGAAHETLLVEAPRAEELSELAYHADEPFGDTSAVALFALARFARRRVTVCLSGDGADELFGGYGTYLADRIHRATRLVPSPVLHAASRLLDAAVPVTHGKVDRREKAWRFTRGHRASTLEAHAAWRCVFTREEAGALLSRDVPPPEPIDEAAVLAADVAGCHYLDQAMYVDIKTWLPDDILVKLDRTTMAHSLEARAPFLDHRIVELAARLPVEMKVRRFEGKAVLRLSQEGRVPRAVLSRPKRGFNSPVSRWISAAEEPGAVPGLSEPALHDWVRPDAVAHLLREHRQRQRDHGQKLHALGSLGLWLSRFGAAGRASAPAAPERAAAAG